MPDVSLIVSVYNNVDFMRFVFAGIERQTYKQFEVIIADDGSDDQMKNFITTFHSSAPFSLQHIWHKRAGWQKNKILNAAIRSAQSNYLIFIDGDCVPHKYFVEEHVRAHQSGAVLCGRRVMLSERITNALDANSIQKGILEGIHIGIIFDAIKGKASRIEDGIYLPSKFLHNLVPQGHNRILGSNFSVEKSLMEKINGFDEEYAGPGLGEDADIQFRLELLGVPLHSVKHRAIQYHLYHSRTVESSDNRFLFTAKKKAGLVFCKNGLIQLI
jgi:glycosyltransferase involved in cell wall biosynthesis